MHPRHPSTEDCGGEPHICSSLGQIARPCLRNTIQRLARWRHGNPALQAEGLLDPPTLTFKAGFGVAEVAQQVRALAGPRLTTLGIGTTWWDSNRLSPDLHNTLTKT